MAYLTLFVVHLLSLFGAICSIFVSHGVRQRNSSVPLRELVGSNRATALIAPIQGPAGRQAVFGIEECPYCDPRKCLTGRHVGICLTIRDGDGILVSSQCLGTRKELNRAMSVRQLPPTARNRRQGCARSGGTGTMTGTGTESGDPAEEETVEELCWCEAAQHRKSLLEDGLANPGGAFAIRHARRRKNHRGIALVDKDAAAAAAMAQQQQRQLPYHQLRSNSSAGEHAANDTNVPKSGVAGGTIGSAILGIHLSMLAPIAVATFCCWLISLNFA